MISVQALLDRIAGGEDEYTEFKSSFSLSDDILLASIVALANGPTEGWIIFGVNDEGTLIGVLGADQFARSLTRLCEEQCVPSLRPDLEIVETEDATVVVLRIRGAKEDQPYRQRDREVYWLRRGARDQVATREDAEQFLEEQHRVWYPQLHTVEVQWFRSLTDVDLYLKPLNIIIGPNASGKSNLIKALHFVREVVAKGDWKRYDKAGHHLLWYGARNGGTRPTRFSINLTVELPEQFGRYPPEYRLAVQLGAEKLALQEECLSLKLSATDSEPVDFIRRQGPQVKHFVESSDGEYSPQSTRLSSRIAALREYGRDASFAPIAALYRFVAGWRFLDVDVEKARESAVAGERPDRIEPLAEDASNLSAFLYSIQHLEQDRFDEIQDRLGRAIGFPNLIETAYRASMTGGPGEAGITFRERAFPEISIPSESMSDGTIRLLAHLAALLGDPDATLLCIEEPDHGLHPHLMLRLADTLRSIVDVEPSNEQYNPLRPQIILTTHSPDFLDCFKPDEEADYLQVFVAERGVTDGETVFRPVDGQELSHWLKKYRLGELVRMGVVR